MRVLDRKLLRELGQTKGQAFAIAMVVASGVAVFVMALSTLSFLRSTRDAYYDRYRFADVFANLRRAPEALAERIAAIPGVGAVQTRIVADVTLDVPGLDEPAVGRLVSLPNPAQAAPLNSVYLRAGRLPDLQRPGEVLASEAFVTANQLQVGDRIEAVINGRQQTLRIVGIGLSPEYVFQMRGGDLLPDNRRFGVFWMQRRQLEAAFDMKGAFNDVTLRLLRGSRLPEVIARLDRLLKPYGGIGAYDRGDQVSARFLDDEIKQLQATAMVSPAIFLGVAAFLLNVVLMRRIAAQRDVIATLKAFGYHNRQVAWHYLKSALVVALVGAVAGAMAGTWLASGLAELYSRFYRFPTFVYRPDIRVLVAGVGLSLLAATAGALHAVYEAVRLAPADAMRPASPSRYRRSWVEWLGLAWLFPLTVRMMLRHLQRRWLTAAFSSLGIASAVAVLVIGNFATDAIDYLMEFQFRTAQRHDVQVVFEENLSPSAAHDLRHLPGVQTAEPFRAVPVRLRHGHRDYRTSIMGLGPRRDLYRLLDTSGRPVRLPPDGLVLSDALAGRLGARGGDVLTVEVLDGQQPVRQVQVAGLVTEFTGANAYMDRAALHRLLREPAVLSGAFLAVDPRFQSSLYDQLKQTPAIASVAVKEATIRQFQETIAENQTIMQSFNFFFAAVIAIGVIYNTARISLDERSRELSTLRVIGFTRREVSSILLGELAVLSLAAIPIGWWMGYGFCYAMVQGFESEMYRIPLVIRPRSYATAALVTLAAAGISGALVQRRLHRMDLVEVLKSRE